MLHYLGFALTLLALASIPGSYWLRNVWKGTTSLFLLYIPGLVMEHFLPAPGGLHSAAQLFGWGVVGFHALIFIFATALCFRAIWTGDFQSHPLVKLAVDDLAKKTKTVLK